MWLFLTVEQVFISLKNKSHQSGNLVVALDDLRCLLMWLKSKKQNPTFSHFRLLLSLLTTFADFCPLLSTFAHFCLLLSFLSTFADFCRLLSFLSTSAHFCRLLSFLSTSAHFSRYSFCRRFPTLTDLTCSTMQASGKLESFLAKRRKKNASKEHVKVPYRRE